MDQPDLRTLIHQLAEDLAWLEEHTRKQPDQAYQAGALRLAAASVRNVLGPFLEKQPASPLHLAVVGGAGAGKSTVANMLSGALLAESNPQAGFTRHPIGYLEPAQSTGWADHLGFLGPLQKLTNPGPSNLDQNVYQLRRVSPPADVISLLDRFVIWDCPDMTTWASISYVPRLLEVSGLADILVYVASDERYNDEVPTQFLKLLLQAGKTVIVVLVKMREADQAAFVAHFQKEVLGKLTGQAAAVMTIPFLSPEQIADPIRQANKFRIPLANQVMVLSNPIQSARGRTVHAALRYLKEHQHDLLGVARRDLDALTAWQRLVAEGQAEFDNRYRWEFLTNERFRRFDEALVKLLDLLEIPGVGKILSGTLTVLRKPFELLRGFFGKNKGKMETPTLPERAVLEASMAGWLNMLRKEAARRAASHPLWQHIHQGFDAGLTDQARKKFEQGVRHFQISIVEEVERTARGIYEDLEKNPVALNTLRSAKLGLEVTAVIGTLIAGGLTPVQFLLVPLAATITHQLVELLGKQYVESQREQARSRQLALVHHYLSAPLADWLNHWPTTGGSQYERLQQALDRIPSAISQVETLVAQAGKTVEHQAR